MTLELLDATPKPLTPELRSGAGLGAAPCSAFRCIVADPPWPYGKFNNGANARKSFSGGGALPLPYKAMTVQEIAALPVGRMAEENAHLYLWTTNRYLPDAFAVMKAWGFRYSQTLVWAKTPGGLGLGGAFAPTTEFVLFGRRGKLPATRRVNSTWWNWKRQNKHSRKPEEFQAVVESVSPGPYLELFARRKRHGWASWGNEIASDVEMPNVSDQIPRTEDVANTTDSPERLSASDLFAPCDGCVNVETCKTIGCIAKELEETL